MLLSICNTTTSYCTTSPAAAIEINHSAHEQRPMQPPHHRALAASVNKPTRAAGYTTGKARATGGG